MKGFSIKKLVSKISHRDFNLNTTLDFMGVEVHCTSGTPEFVSVSAGSLFSFTFDFWTKKLVIEYIDNDTMRIALIGQFKALYKKVEVVDGTVEI